MWIVFYSSLVWRDFLFWYVDGDYGFKKEALACIVTRPRVDGDVLARLQLVCVRETE